jgi:hypothetical protein
VIINNEIEEVLVQRKVQSKYLPEGTKENHENKGKPPYSKPQFKSGNSEIEGVLFRVRTLRSFNR